MDEEKIVKVADFGLSRDLFDSDYYTMTDLETPLPVRWMALEAIDNKTYTTMSDVVRGSSFSVYLGAHYRVLHLDTPPTRRKIMKQSVT